VERPELLHDLFDVATADRLGLASFLGPLPQYAQFTAAAGCDELRVGETTRFSNLLRSVVKPEIKSARRGSSLRLGLQTQGGLEDRPIRPLRHPAGAAL